MKPVLRDGKVYLTLHKPEVKVFDAATDLLSQLATIHSEQQDIAREALLALNAASTAFAPAKDMEGQKSLLSEE